MSDPSSNPPVSPQRVRERSDERIQALQWKGDFHGMEAFVGGDAEVRCGRLVVAGPDGPLSAKIGDWIVKDQRGQFYECSDSLIIEFMGSLEKLP